MTITQLSRWENLTRLHPVPWYVDQCNAKGVTVKDNHGDTVFEDDFGSIPDEMSSSMRSEITTKSIAIALWLVAYSENPYGK